MICARCLLHAVHQLQTAGEVLRTSGLPAAYTVFQGDALCFEHFLSITNLLAWSAVVNGGDAVETEWRDPT
jgi:hypothetical protein